MSSWFQRVKEGISTSTDEKIEAPEGIWVKCPNCKKPTHKKDLLSNQYVCPYCQYHHRIGSDEYFSLLFDNNIFEEMDKDMVSGDPLRFTDTKAYPDRIRAYRQSAMVNDAVRTAHGQMNNIPLTVACMDFDFIGGSMGSVVGEKIARAIDHARTERKALIIISKSGGARMMEGALSLMQMAKTSAKLALLNRAGVPFISLLTNPTTGGVTASFAMLGDFNIAEPNALIGFAGPRVIKETIGKDLPPGFQSSEFLLEHGFVDFIVERRLLKSKLTTLLGLLQPYGGK